MLNKTFGVLICVGLLNTPFISFAATDHTLSSAAVAAIDVLKVAVVNKPEISSDYVSFGLKIESLSKSDAIVVHSITADCASSVDILDSANAKVDALEIDANGNVSCKLNLKGVTGKKIGDSLNIILSYTVGGSAAKIQVFTVIL